MSPLQSQADVLSPGARKLLTGGVLAAHVIGGWALLQIDSVRHAVVEMVPIMVSLVAAAGPPSRPLLLPPLPTPLPAPPQKYVSAPAPTPLIAAAPTPSSASSDFVSALVAVPVPVTPGVTTAVPAPPGPPAPASPPAPSTLKQVPASAVRYLLEPKMSVPLLSRRLGESGTVLLRIVVDVRGHLKDATLHKSSGFARLDGQALQDIRSARFVPQTDNGLPIEWETLAPMAYELD